MSTTRSTDHQQVWDALSHPARRRILDLLRRGPVATGDLDEALDAEGLSPSRFTTQRHLQRLREADLVLVTARGRERLNSLNASALYQATVGWLDQPSRDLATSLDRLRRLAEDPTSKEPAMSDPTPSPVRHLSIHQAIDIAASPAAVWSLLTTRTREWWRPPFTLLGDAEEVELHLPDLPGEAVVEVAGERRAAWGMLTRREENTLLAWTSIVCGADAATGSVRIALEQTSDGGTLLRVDQDAIGVFGDGLEDDVARGWSTKLERIGVLLA